MRKFLPSVFVFFIGMVLGIIFCLSLPQMKIPILSGFVHHHGLSKDILPELSKDSNSPIQYDKETEEYQLKYEAQEGNKKITRTYPLYFSPFTGDKLKSGRSKLFTKPSRNEIQRISKMIEGAKTLEEIERVLGKPDYVVAPLKHGIKKQYTYSNLSESTELVVQLHYDGKLTTYYSGKYVGKKN